MEKKMCVEEVSATGVLDVIQQRANTHRDHTRGTSCTGALWLQYMEMVNILRTFIKAERTANWELHLQKCYHTLLHRVTTCTSSARDYIFSQSAIFVMTILLSTETLYRAFMW